MVQTDLRVIIVDDNEDDYNTIKEICDDLGIATFPRTRREFNEFRSLLCRSLGEKMPADLIARAVEDINFRIEEFTKDADSVLYIIDDELKENSREVTGKAFYKTFAKNKLCLFVSSLQPYYGEEFKTFAQSVGSEVLWKDKTFKDLFTLKLKRITLTRKI